MIKLVPYEEIDKAAYDRCVRLSEMFRIYATSGYLDAVAKTWDVLVMDNYKAVMPLPRRRKYGLDYVYHASFIQQLGVFSGETISKSIEDEFYRKLKSGFILVDYPLHSGSRSVPGCTERVNLVLGLNRDYEQIRDGFNKNRKRIIGKGFADLKLDQNSDSQAFLKGLKRTDLSFAMEARMIKSVERLIAGLPETVRIWNAYLEDEWIGGLLWLEDHRRITYLLPVTTEQGRDLELSTYILDRLIRENQGRDLLLDLEGSMIPGVAQFYRSFGASQETYYFLKSRFYGLL